MSENNSYAREKEKRKYGSGWSAMAATVAAMVVTGGDGGGDGGDYGYSGDCQRPSQLYA